MQQKEYNANLSELLILAQNGDTLARDKIVEENIGLVHSIVKRFAGRGFEAEDLFQIGCIGLIKAIPKFDMSFDVKFSTYAVPMIMGEIKRFIRDDGIIKVSRSVKELAQKALALRENIMRTELREAGIGELANRLGVSREEVAVALEAGIRPDSINAPCGDDKLEGKTLGDRIESSDNCEKKVLDRILIKQLMETLDERERKIMVLRYFKEETQSQIAVKMGISQVQVSRIEKRVLAEMRRMVKE